MRQQVSARFLDGGRIDRLPAFDQTFDAEPNPVAETARPGSVPGSIVALDAFQK